MSYTYYTCRCTIGAEGLAMSVTLTNRAPSDEEVHAASEAAGLMSLALSKQRLLALVAGDADTAEVRLPPALGQLVLDVLREVARGHMVTVLSRDASLTTKEAADLLSVSRPFLTKLLKEGAIPHHRVGSHHRVRAEDLAAYRRARDAARSDALDELQRLGQEFDAA